MRLKLEKLVRELTAKALNACRMTIAGPPDRILKAGEYIVLADDSTGELGFFLRAEIVRVLRSEKRTAEHQRVSEVECVLFTRIR